VNRTLSNFLTMILFMGFVLGLAVVGPDMSPQQRCIKDTLAWTETRLFMGRDIHPSAGGGEVSDAQWQAFADAEVIPRFSDGFTVVDAAGYWKGEGCKAANLPGGCERTKVLLIQHPESDEADKKLEAISNAYRTQFKQQAVMRSDHKVCTQFYSG